MLKKIRNLLPVLKYKLLSLFPFVYDFLGNDFELANINITDRCCQKCKMCIQWEIQNMPEKDITFWTKALDQLKEVGVNRVNFTGGEPLMRKDITELISYTRSIGMRPMISTNGYLLNEKKLDELIQAGLKTIYISMDATGSDYDRIRGIKGGYEKLIYACKLISDYKKKNIFDACINFTIMKSTLDHYKSVFEIMKELQLPLVVNLLDYRSYFLRKEENKTEEWIGEKDFNRLEQFVKDIVRNKMENKNFTVHYFSDLQFILDYFKDPLQKKLPCIVSQNGIHIDSQGQFYGGCWAMGVFGDLSKQKLKDILSSKIFKSIKKDMFYKKCCGCSCGYAVNLRYNFDVLVKEMIFRMNPKVLLNRIAH